MTHYPVVLVNLGNVTVVGGGDVATRKVRGLLDAGLAQVTVIAPLFTAQLENWAAANLVLPVRRAYRQGDLENARLVIAATDDEWTNASVWREALERDIPVNAVDDPAHCTFHVPAVIRRGNLAIAISTGGTSPALAKYMRRELERIIGPEYEHLSTLMAELRPRINSQFPVTRRESIWDAIVETALPLLRDGQERQARLACEDILSAAARD